MIAPPFDISGSDLAAAFAKVLTRAGFRSFIVPADHRGSYRIEVRYPNAPLRDPFASVTLAVMTSGALRLEHGPNAALTAEVLDAFKLARPGEHHHAVTRMHAQGEVVLASERVALELAFLLNAREPSPVWQVTPAAPRQP